MINFESLKTKERIGSNFNIPKDTNCAMFISQRNEIFCYIGIFDENKYFNETIPISFAHTNVSLKNQRSMIRIVEGMIIKDYFIDSDFYARNMYKKLDYSIILPNTTSSYFGIININTRVEEKELTRAVFGLCYDELNCFLERYSEVMNSSYNYPRITRSIKKDNSCDLLGAWIPKNFPYINFAGGSQYKFGHLSLDGFYRFISLLLVKGKYSPLYYELCKDGIEKENLDRILSLYDEFYRMHRIII